MKKIIPLLIALTLTGTFCKKNNNTEVTGVKGIVLQDSLSLKSSPDVSSQVLMQLNKGELITIVDKTQEYFCLVKGELIGRDDSRFKDCKYALPWYKIDYKGKRGWVFGEYIGVDVNSDFFSNTMYGEVQQYGKVNNRPLLNYNGLEINVHNKKYTLTFFIKNATQDDFDSIPYKILCVFIDNENGRGVINDYFSMNETDVIKGIYLINNTASIIVYEEYHCDTAPCTGKAFAVFNIIENRLVFSQSYLETGDTCEDSELMKYIIIRDDKIIFNIMEYNVPEYDNPEKESKCDYKYLAGYQEIFSRKGELVTFEKKTVKTSIKGKINKNTMLFEDPDMKDDEAELPLHTEVTIIKGKMIHFHLSENTDSVFYVESKDEKGWCSGSSITIYDEFFNSLIHCKKPVKDIYNESKDIVLIK